MPAGLFRQEVIDARHGERLGNILAATPLSRWTRTVTAAALIAATIFGHSPHCEGVTGQLALSAEPVNLPAISALSRYMKVSFGPDRWIRGPSLAVKRDLAGRRQRLVLAFFDAEQPASGIGRAWSVPPGSDS